METELLGELLDDLGKKNILSKYRIVFPKMKESLTFLFELDANDILSILNLTSDIGKILRINELQKQYSSEEKIKNNNISIEKVLVK